MFVPKVIYSSDHSQTIYSSNCLTLFYLVCFLSSFPSFFVVEDHVLHTTQGLVNRAYVEELWELALSKIIAALRTHSVRTQATQTQNTKTC